MVSLPGQIRAKNRSTVQSVVTRTRLSARLTFTSHVVDAFSGAPATGFWKRRFSPGDPPRTGGLPIGTVLSINAEAPASAPASALRWSSLRTVYMYADVDRKGREAQEDDEGKGDDDEDLPHGYLSS